MENDNLEQELDKNKFAVVKYGLIILSLAIVLILYALTILKIDDKPILYMVIDYYIHQN